MKPKQRNQRKQEGRKGKQNIWYVCLIKRTKFTAVKRTEETKLTQNVADSYSCEEIPMRYIPGILQKRRKKEGKRKQGAVQSVLRNMARQETSMSFHDAKIARPVI